TNDNAQRFIETDLKDFKYNNKDPLGTLTYFFRYLAINGSSYTSLLSLVTLPGLISASRNYRNLAAHNMKNGYKFNLNESRVAINLVIEVFRVCKSNPEFWAYLNK